MAIRTKELQGEHMALIRWILVYSPDAEPSEVQHQLEQPTRQRPNGLHVDIRYVKKLLGKVRGERKHRDNYKTRERISELQDQYRAMLKEVRGILSDPLIRPEDKINALIKMFDENIQLFKIEQSTGMFEKAAEKVELEVSGTVKVESDPQRVLNIIKIMQEAGALEEPEMKSLTQGNGDGSHTDTTDPDIGAGNGTPEE